MAAPGDWERRGTYPGEEPEGWAGEPAGAEATPRLDLQQYYSLLGYLNTDHGQYWFGGQQPERPAAVPVQAAVPSRDMQVSA
jgi:hypothetical protein